jgi:UBX domain-containing protein 1/4
MDHILEHDGEPIPDLTNAATGSAAPSAGSAPLQDSADVDGDEDSEALRAALKLSTAPGADSSGTPAEAKVVNSFICSGRALALLKMFFILQSIMCSVCQKIFRNMNEANFHAEKSGHDQFEESTEEVFVQLSCWLIILTTANV